MINVKDAPYNAIGDGVTDDTAAINAAIVAAAGTDIIHYPNGNYKRTGNLVNFWLNTRSGHGKITDGTNSYGIHPQYFGDINTLWVNSSTGNDNNDGLTPGLAFKTLAGLSAKLQRLSAEEVGRGQWKVRLSGTFDGAEFSGLKMFRKGLTFEGDALSSGIPVTEIKKGITALQYGLRFEPNSSAQIIVKNIFFKDFRVGFNGYGILMKDLGILEIIDCHFDNCDTGVKADRNVSFTGTNLKATNCTTGFTALYSSSGTWSYCSAIDCVTGFLASRSAVAHVDYATISDCDVAMEVSQNSRMGVIGGDFKRNGIVHNAIGGGEYITGVSDTDETAIPNYNVGTADANTINYRHRGTGKETRLYGQYSTNEFRQAFSYPNVNHTATTTDTVIYITPTGQQLPAALLTDSGKKIRFRAFGTFTGTGGTKTIAFRRTNMDGSTNVLISSYTFPASATGAWTYELELVPYLDNGTNYTGIQRAESTQVAAVIQEVNITNSSVNATDTRFRLNVQLANSADNIKIKGMEIYLQG